MSQLKPMANSTGETKVGRAPLPHEETLNRTTMIPQGPLHTFIPDPKKHLYVSLVKSGIRIVGYLLLFGIPSQYAIAAAVILVTSEVVGIVEELV